VQIGIALAGEVQEKGIQSAEFLAVVTDGAVFGKHRDVPCQTSFPGVVMMAT